MSQRPPAMFVGDALGLDFLNSVATPVDTPVDWIDDGDGLLNWLEQAQLVPADALEADSGRGPPRRARQGRRSGAEPARVVQRLCARAQGASADGEELLPNLSR